MLARRRAEAVLGPAKAAVARGAAGYVSLMYLSPCTSRVPRHLPLYLDPVPALQLVGGEAAELSRIELAKQPSASTTLMLE
mgnify:CR=1 FL=1